MNTHADSIAFRTLFVLGLSIVGLLWLRLIPTPPRATENLTTPVTVRRSPTPAAPQYSGRPIIFRPEPSEPIEARAVRPIIVKQAPTPSPHITRIHVGPNEWSAPINVPEGEEVGIRFTLGRIQVEHNGRDIGLLYRNPIFEPSNEAPNAVRMKPFAMLNRTPREVWFKENTRVLRFRSMEKRSEEVEVLWKD